MLLLAEFFDRINKRILRRVLKNIKRSKLIVSIDTLVAVIHYREEKLRENCEPDSYV